MLFEEDLKPGEEVLFAEEVISDTNPIFDPSTRPELGSAIEMITGESHGYRVPFGSATSNDQSSTRDQDLFRCLFGRDSLLISDLLRDEFPEFLENSLLALASVQGEKFDSASEEEPGRIPHEVRNPDDPRAIEITRAAGWKFPYYGSVDATLIWLRLFNFQIKKDESFSRRIVGNKTMLNAALMAGEWLLHRIDGKSGLIESVRTNPKGIKNQFWKDSGDSYVHSDGQIAHGAVSSIETAADAFDALMALSDLQATFPEAPWQLTEHGYIERAEELRERAISLMWMGNQFALGTERDSEDNQIPINSLASNQGRIMDSAFLVGERYKKYRDNIAEHLLSRELLTTAGIRTLSSNHASYRPGGYHTGSSWPMDSAFIARGLIRHGFFDQGEEIAHRIRTSIESIGGYPEFFRGDAPRHGLINRSIVDVRTIDGFENRVVQPPQLIQGWSVAAYAWSVSVSDKEFEAKSSK